MEFLPLVTIPVLFIAIAFVKPHIQHRIPWSICAMCGSVLGTWLLLWILHFSGVSVPPLMIGILMGMSVSGLVYKLEPFYARRKIRHFWFVRMVIILGGFYGISMALAGRWGAVFPIAIFGLLAIVIASFFFQGLTHEDVVKEAGKSTGRSLLKKLDNCC